MGWTGPISRVREWIEGGGNGGFVVKSFMSVPNIIDGTVICQCRTLIVQTDLWQYWALAADT
eukprot:2458288-Rhodomonas_salina.1